MLYYLFFEWTAWRAHGRARRILSGRPGVFVSFSPSAGARLYDGAYEHDWGFAAFEADSLAFRGDRGSWTVARREIREVRRGDGPRWWLPKPVVCFQLNSGDVFWLRPLDGAFGPAAPIAASRLLEQAVRWHKAADTGTTTEGDHDFLSLPGQPLPHYTRELLWRSLTRCSAVAVAISWVLRGPNAWSDPPQLLIPAAATSILLLFVAYPILRNGRQREPQRAPLTPAGSPEGK